jgi:hypothetical protein
MNRFRIFFKATTLGIPRRDSISRPLAPISSVAGGDDIIRPRCQGFVKNLIYWWIL